MTLALRLTDACEALVPLRDATSCLFEDSFIGMGRFNLSGWALLLDIRETADMYTSDAVLPGIKQDELQIVAPGDIIAIGAIRGERS